MLSPTISTTGLAKNARPDRIPAGKEFLRKRIYTDRTTNAPHFDEFITLYAQKTRKCGEGCFSTDVFAPKWNGFK